MKIAVFDYLNGSVDIIETDLSCIHTEQVEQWLGEHGYHLSSIAWMGDVKNIAFKDMKNQ
jgi:hypothetical protein